MYAVVKTGGKQYRVARNDVIIVERLAAEAGAGIELDQVLLLNDGKDTMIGTPLVEGARVAATVLDQSRADKIIVFKKKRRKDYRRTRGHRQLVTVLRITDILGKGQKPSAAKAKAPVKAKDVEASAAAKATAAPEDKAEAAPRKPAKTAAPRKAPAKKAAPKKTSETKSAKKPAATAKAAPKKAAPAKKPAATAKAAPKKAAPKKPAAGKSGAKSKSAKPKGKR